MTYKKSVDANQGDIVSALRRAGCSVTVLSRLGGGVPDLLVGRHGQNFLLEVKDGDKPPSARKLTPDELAWMECWRGAYSVVTSVDTAMEAVGVRANV